MQIQLCEHGRRMADKIDPQQDGTAIAANIPRMLSIMSPRPIHYYNFNVGECKDLIFGVSLVDYATARGPLEGDVPKIIRICIEEIDRRGLDAEGIYRASKNLVCPTFCVLTRTPIVGIWKARGCARGMVLRRT